MEKIYIDGTDVLSSHGIFLVKSSGMFDALIPKHKYKHDWADEHGVQYSHTDKLFKARNISLKLGLKTTTEAAFKQGIHNFLELFYTPGLHQLKFESLAKVYMVDLRGQKPMQRLTSWNSSLNVGQFQINLIEPEPVNRQFTATGTTCTVNLDCSDDSVFTIYWNDSNREIDTISDTTSPVANSTMVSGNIIVVAGRTEKINTLSVTNGTEITW